MYYTCDHPDKFLPEVVEAITALENRFIADSETVERTSNALFNGGHDDLALQYLTDYSSEAARSALQLGNALLASIEARTKVLFGIRAPQTDEMSRYGGDVVECN